MQGRLVVVATLLAGAARASSPEPNLAFSVAYSAPPECAGRTDFEQAVVARAPGAHPVAANEATLLFEAEIVKRAAEFSAVLWVTLRDGTRSRRDVTGETCVETLSTLAVIAALSLNGYREARNRENGSAPADALSDQPAPLPAPVEPLPTPPAEAPTKAPAKVDRVVRKELR